MIQLEDIIQIKHGFAFKGEYFVDEETECVLVTPGNFSIGGGFKTDKLKYYNGPVPSAYVLKQGDVIVTMTDLSKEADTLGYSAKVPRIPKTVFLHNQRIGLVSLKNDNYDIEYIYWVLRTYDYQRYIAGAATGATVKHTSPSKIGSYKFNPHTNLPTQRRIASILSAYDDLIENNLKRIKLLEDLAQRTYEEWFVKFRINGEQLPIDEKTGLPEGWEKRPLNEIAEIISGFAFKSGDYVKDGKYKIVTIKNVQDGCFIPETTDSLTEVPRKVKQSQILKSGDIILSLTGNVGRTCLVFGQNYLLNQRVAKLVAKRPEHYSFIYFLLRSKAMVVALENLSNGAAQQNLSPINMGNYLVALPDDEVLNRYSNQFNNHIDLICQLNNEITLLKESRDILLPSLMSGKINVE